MTDLPPGSDPAPYAAAGATWCLVEFDWQGITPDQVRGVIAEQAGLVRRFIEWDPPAS